jgi:hypothetical protein
MYSCRLINTLAFRNKNRNSTIKLNESHAIDIKFSYVLLALIARATSINLFQETDLLDYTCRSSCRFVKLIVHSDFRTQQ